MTVSTSSYTPLSYIGNGSTDTFSVSFVFIHEDHLVVTVDDVVQVLDTDYTVTGGGDGSIPATGSIVFNTAPAADAEILIERETPRIQEQNYVDNAKLPADVLEAQLDRLILVAQETDYKAIDNQGDTGPQGPQGEPGVDGVSDGDKGDITVSSSGTVFTIDNGVVTTAKLGGDITTAGKALLDDADASAQRTTLGLGTLATQSGTFSGTSSGTNTGDQNLFATIAVSGQGDVVADSTSDTLTLVAGTNVTITTNAGSDSITINSTASGGSALSTATFSGQASASFVSLTNTYNAYKVILSDVTAAGNYLAIQFTTDNVSYISSQNYITNIIEFNSGSTSASIANYTSGSNASKGWLMNNGFIQGGCTGELLISGIGNSTKPIVSYQLFANANGTMYTIEGTIIYNSAITATGFKLYDQFGGTFSAGKIMLYGLN